MWLFKKKKPKNYPILMLYGIGQKLTFTPYPDRVLYVQSISLQHSYGAGLLELRIEAIEL